jgi:hypothetical protein
MSLLDAAGSEGDSGVANNGGSTSGKSMDELNNEFQNSTGKEGQGTNEAAKEQGAGWWYDENLPGEGERPEWLKDKYKSAAEQAKAYNELDKKLGKFKGAPEEYDLTLPEMPDFKFEEGDPMLSDFLNMAKDAGASQEFVTSVLNHYVKTQSFYAPDPQQEMEKLGVNAKQEISHLADWASQRLDKNEMEVFKGMVVTADAVRVLQKLRRAATSQSEVATDGKKAMNSSNPQITERQLNEMIADPRFSTDPLFRKEVEAHAQRVWG